MRARSRLEMGRPVRRHRGGRRHALGHADRWETPSALQAPYSGHEGLRANARDISQVWKSLELAPTAFRVAKRSVIVFGRADSRSGTETNTVYVLWVWQLRDGLITSVEVFPTSHRPGARPSAERTPARYRR